MRKFHFSFHFFIRVLTAQPELRQGGVEIALALARLHGAESGLCARAHLRPGPQAASQLAAQPAAQRAVKLLEDLVVGEREHKARTPRRAAVRAQVRSQHLLAATPAVQ